MASTGISKYFNALIHKAEEHITEAYSQRLKDHALDYDWPVDIVKGLKIVHNNGDHQIAYPQELEEKILTLEYGTPSIPPSPVLRTFSLGIEG
jgi:hypothetical protein